MAARKSRAPEASILPKMNAQLTARRRFTEALREKSVNCDRARGVKSRHEEERHDEDRENSAHVQDQVGEVAVESEVGNADEGGGGEHRRHKRNGDGPRGEGAAAEEIIRSILAPASPADPQSDAGDKGEVDSDHAPIQRAKYRQCAH